MGSNLLRMTGMNSGMDTEAVVSALVSTRQKNIDKVKKSQKKLEWTQDAWKEMNSKIYGLYAGKLSSLRFSDSYSKKVTKTSNSALSVIAGKDAAIGVQTAKINSVAKAGYMTGAEIEGSSISGDTRLSELGIETGSRFTINVAGEDKEIEVTDGMTLSSLTSELKNAGVNANFDAVNKRLFVSSKATGKDNDFKFTASDANGADALAKLGLDESHGATKIKATDAELELNGVKFTSDRNSFVINGSTYNVSAETTETITVTTENDTSGVYDTIKSFLKEYNEVMNAMCKGYNAESANGYEPLTDEERDALSDKQAEEWEKKVKDSLLRHDSTLGDIMEAMRGIMAEGIEIGGRTYYLSDFGVNTQGYFEASENERYSYHIDGDSDDLVSGNKEDVLKGLIASNPELVSDFFSQLSTKLYDKMYEKMGSSDYSSIYKVYNDKQMKKDYDEYTKKIAEMEQKLSDYEDRYYKRFSKMETALAKLNSQQNALAGLLGMNS